MELLKERPASLASRHLPNSVAIHCDCGDDFLWPVAGGDTVRCPTCKTTATLPVGEAGPLPFPATPATSTTDRFPVNATVLTSAPLPTDHPQGLAQFDRTLAVAVSSINKESKMQDVVALPDNLNSIMTKLTANARTLNDRLSKATDRHSIAVARGHKMAEVIETATAKTDEFINQMMGTGNGGPPLSDGSQNSPAS